MTNEAFTSYPMTQFAFPNGRQITNTFDALYRRTEVENTGGSSIAKWQFFGPGRLAECVLGNGLIMTNMNNSRTRSARQEGLASPVWGNQSSDRLGYDGVGRMIAKRFLAGGINGGTHAYNNTSSVVGQTTVFDKGSNKLYERELHAESRSHLYEQFDDQAPLGGLDSLNRLRQYQRGVLSGTGGYQNAGGGSIVTPISLPGTDHSRTYQLDGLGNWHHTVYTPVGGSQVNELRQHNGLNQITSIDDGGGNVPFSYDLSGNLLNDGIRAYAWDALNRLKNVYKDPNGTPEIIGAYDYDALGRRIRKVVSNGGLSGTIPNGATDFVYNSNWQCVEERDANDDPTKQYVWGVYIDELVQQRNEPAGTPADLYPLQDLLYRTTALTNASGAIVEAYDCDAYGNTLIFDAPGTGGDWWVNDASKTSAGSLDFIYTGQRFDPESTLYCLRLRYYDSLLGRFVSRDVIGYRSGLNLQQFVTSRPGTHVDPFGMLDYAVINLPDASGNAQLIVRFDESDCGTLKLIVDGDVKILDQIPDTSNGPQTKTYAFKYDWLRQDEDGRILLDHGSGVEEIGYSPHEVDWNSESFMLSWSPAEGFGVHSMSIYAAGSYVRYEYSFGPKFNLIRGAAKWTSGIGVYGQATINREAGEKHLFITSIRSPYSTSEEHVKAGKTTKSGPGVQAGPGGGRPSWRADYETNISAAAGKWFVLGRKPELSVEAAAAVAAPLGAGVGYPREAVFKLP